MPLASSLELGYNVHGAWIPWQDWGEETFDAARIQPRIGVQRARRLDSMAGLGRRNVRCRSHPASNWGTTCTALGFHGRTGAKKRSMPLASSLELGYNVHGAWIPWQDW